MWNYNFLFHPHTIRDWHSAATVSAFLAGEEEVLTKVWTGVHGDVQEQQALYKHQDVGVFH